MGNMGSLGGGFQLDLQTYTVGPRKSGLEFGVMFYARV